MDAQLDHKGKLSLNLYDLLASLPPEALVDLVDALAVQDAVIEQVANQIATGWTDSVSCAACDDDAASPRYALGKARRFLALHADAVAAKQVADMARTLVAVQEELADMKAWGKSMFFKMDDYYENRHVWAQRRAERATKEHANG